MISSCDQCGRILPFWKLRCCKKSAMNWLHLAGMAGLALPVIFILLKFVL